MKTDQQVEFVYGILFELQNRENSVEQSIGRAMFLLHFSSSRLLSFQ